MHDVVQSAVDSTGHGSYHHYPVHVCTVELCVWSHWFVYVCLYMYICGQKNDYLGSYCLQISHQLIYCLLFEYNHKKGGLLHQAVCSGKEIWRHSINGTGKGFLENCITVSHTSSTCNAAILVEPDCVYYAMLLPTAVQAFATGIGYTDSAQCALGMFCGTLVQLKLPRGHYYIITSTIVHYRCYSLQKTTSSYLLLLTNNRIKQNMTTEMRGKECLLLVQSN